ncbi:MAG: fructose-6-phosphate aldolase [Candidatus Thermoplasmatota archaeon]|uniref:Probable transaldolase n=2 Tax=Candidatus Sysuiplasma superficiale TaxID=2823368 RepID=A0A8J7YUJ7_9ARCH|nr:fructose-6-phosphate aldolase [Candidatus Sysuiplasma superficiale]MCL4346814.1 fructose-6-phosphate aldolase [Candidatus Thermoplasmatota archaeon]
MKIFVDTANIEEIRQAWEWGLIEGVTTNPSLVSKEGKRFSDVLDDICDIVDGPVNAEVVSTDYEGMMREGRELAKINRRIVVKVPMTAEGLMASKSLSSECIRTNMTLVFSSNQAILAAKTGAAYVSPFIGRLDDIGNEGMQIVREISQIYRNYGFRTEILVASVRNPIHVLEAAKLGADVVTLPFGVLKQMMRHSLTDAGLERFLKDWEKVPR